MMWLVSVALGAGLTLTPAVPVQGQPVRVQVDLEASEELRVTYRPNSAVESTETLALDAGVATWTPSQPGIAVLAVEADGASVSRNVSVRFAGIPWSGVLVFLGTGTLLFGGAGFAMRRMFLQDGAPMPPPLDT